jgi:23S rRNA G2445 N2-methylase RlmL
MTRWVCAHDSTPLGAFDIYCPTCGDDTIAIEGAQRHPDPIRPGQYRAICAYFTTCGIVNRAERMRDLSKLAGHAVSDYWELSAAEATAAMEALKERATHGTF